jgi:hypothetical protein
MKAFNTAALAGLIIVLSSAVGIVTFILDQFFGFDVNWKMVGFVFMLLAVVVVLLYRADSRSAV